MRNKIIGSCMIILGIIIFMLFATAISYSSQKDLCAIGLEEYCQTFIDTFIEVGEVLGIIVGVILSFALMIALLIIGVKIFKTKETRK